MFRLYDSSETVVNKQEVSESGVVSEKPFNVTQYELIGDTFSYITIKKNEQGRNPLPKV